MTYTLSLSFVGLVLLGHVVASPLTQDAPAVNVTTCAGKTYAYESLAGWGIWPSDARDKFGDTIGGFGSAIALDKKKWKKKKGNTEAYDGILYGLPDRGWNTQVSFFCSVNCVVC